MQIQTVIASKDHCSSDHFPHCLSTRIRGLERQTSDCCHFCLFFVTGGTKERQHCGLAHLYPELETHPLPVPCFVLLGLFSLQLSVCLWWHDYRRNGFPSLKPVPACWQPQKSDRLRRPADSESGGEPVASKTGFPGLEWLSLIGCEEACWLVVLVQVRGGGEHRGRSACGQAARP